MSFHDYIKEATDYKKAVPFLQQAIMHLDQAAKSMEQADKFISTDDAKYYKSEIEKMISHDSGQAGLKKLVDMFKKKSAIS